MSKCQGSALDLLNPAQQMITGGEADQSGLFPELEVGQPDFDSGIQFLPVAGDRNGFLPALPQIIAPAKSGRRVAFTVQNVRSPGATTPIISAQLDLIPEIPFPGPFV